MLLRTTDILDAYHGQRAFALLRRPGTYIDLHGGGHPRCKHHAFGHRVDMDAHRDTLGQPHPGEDRVDIGDPLPVGLRVGDIDRAGDAVDMAAHDYGIAHQLDLGRVADMDRVDVGLLE